MTIHTYAHVTIAAAGLVTHTIRVTADSIADLVEHDTGVNVWYALMVDGTYYDLVMWKHVQGRPEHVASMDRVLAEVEAAIADLQPASPVPPTTPPVSGKTITYDRECQDFRLEFEGQLIGWAKTYSDGERIIDDYVYELLRHTAVESADQAAEMAALEDEAPQTPLAARAIPLTPGAHDLDDGDVHAAYTAALAHPEMVTTRWQNALRKAFDHLREDRFVVAINQHGAYCWWAGEGEGGSYAPTAGTCQCIAFTKDQPCKHVACSILLTFLPVVTTDEIAEAYAMIMHEVERCAA